MSLAWKLRRLSAMERGEIAWRVRRELSAGLERLGVGAAQVPTPSTARTGAAWVARLPTGFDSDKYRGAADRILAGDFNVFALRPAKLGFPPRWNRDPKTGREAPMTFGTSLNY